MTLLSEAVFAVIDTETTGLDTAKDQLVEIGCVATTSKETAGMFATLVNPDCEIPPEVSAIHYLTKRDLVNAPDRFDARLQLAYFCGKMGDHAAIAHNAAFDAPFIDGGGGAVFNWACTKRLAQHVFPDAPTFKNQGLRFWFGLDVDTFGILPHRALGDALVTAEILRHMLASDEFAALGVQTVGELVDLSVKPILYRTWPFGKYAGQQIAGTDPGYLRWALTNLTANPDLIFTVKTVLGAK